MIHNEKELTNAIMNGDYRIELSVDLVSAVRKIKDPTEVVWKAVFSALVASAFFWCGVEPMTLGLVVGLPAILAEGEVYSYGGEMIVANSEICPIYGGKHKF